MQGAWGPQERDCSEGHRESLRGSRQRMKAKPCSWERVYLVWEVWRVKAWQQETHFPAGMRSPVLLEWWLCLFGDQEAGRLARAQSRKPPVEVRAESKAFSQGYHRLLVRQEGPMLPRTPQMGYVLLLCATTGLELPPTIPATSDPPTQDTALPSPNCGVVPDPTICQQVPLALIPKYLQNLTISKPIQAIAIRLDHCRSLFTDPSASTHPPSYSLVLTCGQSGTLQTKSDQLPLMPPHPTGSQIQSPNSHSP